MTLAIIGQTGQLARALIARAEGFGFEAQSFSRQDIDLSAPPNVIAEFVEKLNVRAVIIAAAYTAVDKAETDHHAAMHVNAQAPKIIAEICAAKDIALVHISTDYVFNGTSKTPYLIDTPTDPINTYGRTKHAGEHAVLSAHKRAAVLRTSWVFDGTGQNFMTTMLRLGQTRDSLNVVDDQIGRPTYAGHLADSALTVARTLTNEDYENIAGLYHVTGGGPEVSWAGFAKAIFKHAENNLPHSVTVTAIPGSDYPTPAARPDYSVLDLSRFESSFYTLPDWRDGLEHAYQDWVKHVN